MRFYLAGSGNMAWFLAEKLIHAGHECAGIYGRNKDAVRTLAQAWQLPVCTDVSQIKDDADCCILAVPDSVIAEITGQLALKHTVLVHTSGASPVSLLQDGSKHAGVMWFIYSIVKDDLPRHRQIPCAYEATGAHSRDVLAVLMNSITDITFEADAGKRKKLHLAAVFGNNFANHLMSITEQICVQNDLPFSLLKPILRQTVDRISNTSPFRLQTGPAKRNDEETIRQHLALLQNYPHWQHIYESVNQSIIAMYNNSSLKKA